jgi:hypothetical protein
VATSILRWRTRRIILRLRFRGKRLAALLFFALDPNGSASNDKRKNRGLKSETWWSRMLKERDTMAWNVSSKFNNPFSLAAFVTSMRYTRRFGRSFGAYRKWRSRQSRSMPIPNFIIKLLWTLSPEFMAGRGSRARQPTILVSIAA